MAESKSSQRVYLSRTEREWKTIDKRMKEIGRKDLTSYIVGRISLLEKQYSADRNMVINSVPEKIQKTFFIKKDAIKLLKLISIKKNIPVATLIDRLFIDPLMMPLD